MRIGVLPSSIITFSQEKSETAKLVPPAGWQLFWRLLKNISAYRRPCFFDNYIFARKLRKSKIGAPYGVELFLSAPSSVHPSSIHPSMHHACIHPASRERERESEYIIVINILLIHSLSYKYFGPFALMIQSSSYCYSITFIVSRSLFLVLSIHQSM